MIPQVVGNREARTTGFPWCALLSASPSSPPFRRLTRVIVDGSTAHQWRSPPEGENSELPVLFLDIYGTCLDLQTDLPTYYLAELGRLGLRVDMTAAQAAFKSAMGIYAQQRFSCHSAADDAAMRCVMALEALRTVSDQEPDPANVAQLATAFQDWGRLYRVHEDVFPALRVLRREGWRVWAFSNWDHSFGGVMVATGLAAYLDGQVTSGMLGFEKPHPRFFQQALIAAGDDECVFVGDTLEQDVLPAAEMGYRSYYVDRRDKGPWPTAGDSWLRVADLAQLTTELRGADEGSRSSAE